MYVCAPLYVFIHICIYVYIYTYLHIYIYDIYIYKHIHVSTYIHIFACTRLLFRADGFILAPRADFNFLEALLRALRMARTDPCMSHDVQYGLVSAIMAASVNLGAYMDIYGGCQEMAHIE